MPLNYWPTGRLMKRILATLIAAVLLTSCAQEPTTDAGGIPTYKPRPWWQPAPPGPQSSGSGVQHQTLVDYQKPGYDAGKYKADNWDCNALANHRPVGDSVGQGAVGGLVLGTVLGAIVGNAGGNTGYGAAYGAALGTASGAAQGGAEGVSRHTRIVQECMRGRDYTVLD